MTLCGGTAPGGNVTNVMGGGLIGNRVLEPSMAGLVRSRMGQYGFNCGPQFRSLVIKQKLGSSSRIIVPLSAGGQPPIPVTAPFI